VAPSLWMFDWHRRALQKVVKELTLEAVTMHYTILRDEKQAWR
jgi:hypothetical protein